MEQSGLIRKLLFKPLDLSQVPNDTHHTTFFVFLKENRCRKLDRDFLSGLGSEMRFIEKEPVLSAIFLRIKILFEPIDGSHWEQLVERHLATHLILGIAQHLF